VTTCQGRPASRRRLAPARLPVPGACRVPGLKTRPPFGTIPRRTVTQRRKIRPPSGRIPRPVSPNGWNAVRTHRRPPIVRCRNCRHAPPRERQNLQSRIHAEDARAILLSNERVRFISFRRPDLRRFASSRLTWSCSRMNGPTLRGVEERVRGLRTGRTDRRVGKSRTCEGPPRGGPPFDVWVDATIPGASARCGADRRRRPVP